MNFLILLLINLGVFIFNIMTTPKKSIKLKMRSGLVCKSCKCHLISQESSDFYEHLLKRHMNIFDSRKEFLTSLRRYFFPKDNDYKFDYCESCVRDNKIKTSIYSPFNLKIKSIINPYGLIFDYIASFVLIITIISFILQINIHAPILSFTIIISNIIGQLIAAMSNFYYKDRNSYNYSSDRNFYI